ncbi:MAG: hypothetical protein JWR85_4211 [Marmoricola sp.]|jgi:hypothetical protein|nr:hypothetical protein [Marmoricola sp.]
MKTKQLTAVVILIECEKPVKGLASHVAQRAYMIEGVSNAIVLGENDIKGLDVQQLSQAFDRMALQEHNERKASNG